MTNTIRFKIKRQDSPDSSPYWQEFEIPYKAGHNAVSALMVIRETPVTRDGKKVKPVVWECNCMEEVCGACTMLINGEVKQSCSALIDDLDQPIVLEPMSKFPVVRDLMVDRNRMFENLKKSKAWVDIDGSWDIHEGAPRISQEEWDRTYIFSRCITCGSCLEVCPQFDKDNDFMGAQIIAQVYLKNTHPTGKFKSADRLHALMGKGGIAECGNAQNCVEVCPKEIPLTTAIGDVGRQVTFQVLKDWFGK